MEAIASWLEWLGDILYSVWENITNIGTWVTGAVEKIKFAVTVPTAALDVVDKLVDYFPGYFWVPILSLLSLVLTFRVMKIFLSGG